MGLDLFRRLGYQQMGGFYRLSEDSVEGCQPGLPSSTNTCLMRIQHRSSCRSEAPSEALDYHGWVYSTVLYCAVLESTVRTVCTILSCQIPQSGHSSEFTWWTPFHPHLTPHLVHHPGFPIQSHRLLALQVAEVRGRRPRDSRLRDPH
jgi:hypothetical protein